MCTFLAQLWGAYAIPLALSVVDRRSSVKCANVYHVPGLCLGAPTSVIKLWLENHIFSLSTSSLKQPAGGASYHARCLPKPRPS